MLTVKPRILVVEDEAIVALDIQRQLIRLGYDVPTVAHSGSEAIARTEDSKPDLVIMDIVLKGKQTGIEVAQHITVTFDIPVVFLSAYADDATLEKANESEPYAYLIKPFDERELHSTIKTALNKHNLLRQLKRSEARFRGILEIATDAIVSVDTNQRIILFNKGAEKTFGYTSEEILGEHLSVLLPEEQVEKHEALVADFEYSDRPFRMMGEQRPVFGRRKSGDLFPAESSISRLDGPEGPVFTAILRDISDRRELEEQLLQSQKMEAFGKLAGGVAHDFNNLLMPILGYCDLLQDAHSSEKASAEAIGEIRAAADRGAALTRQLLSFSRKSVIELAEVELNRTVQNMENMLRRLIGSGIAFDVDLDPDSGYIKIDRSELEQIVVNLVVNARDAVEQNGSITIRTARVDSRKDEGALDCGLAPGMYAALVVSDTGLGMDAAMQARVFEPFYTTKALGEGTGLGLSTVHGIVKRNGGEIYIDSAPGEGARFSVYLPSLDPKAVRTRIEAKEKERMSGSEVILLVEDEDMVLKVVTMFLEKGGYTVLQASEPDEALRICADHEGAIDLMVTDMVMPGMNGRRLAEAVAETRPDMKVIIMSGFREHGEKEPETWETEHHFIQKPFASKQLLSKVRDVLDSAKV